MVNVDKQSAHTFLMDKQKKLNPQNHSLKAHNNKELEQGKD